MYVLLWQYFVVAVGNGQKKSSVDLIVFICYLKAQVEGRAVTSTDINEHGEGSQPKPS